MSNSNVSPTSNLDEDEQLHHPRIHARNLSIFFPHPDQQQELKTSALVDNHQEEEQVLEIPSAKLVGWDIHSLHSPPPSSSSSHPPPPPTSLSSSSSRTRRGHHHRHSLSHNFFPFLSEKPVSACSDHQTSQKDREDDSPASKHQQNRAGGDHKKAIISPTWSFPKTPVTPNSALPKPVPTEPHNTSPLQSLPRSSTSLIRRTHRSMALQLIYTLLTLPSKLLQLRILVALLALALGAILWLRGQQTDCLSLAGLGYLLVFDALGAFHAVFFNPRPDDSIDRIWEALGRRDSASSIRLPFGRARLATLSVFTQALFLLFSAIYVCKEAVEHMMMSHPHGPDNAGGGGGSHVGHSERHQSEMQVSCTLVGSALALVLFNALVSNNHRSMALIAIGGKQAGLPEPVLNPFSTISLGFGLLVMGAGCFVSPSQSGKADGLIALLIVFVIIKLVWPVLVDTASVLLQTAPSEKSVLNKVTSDLTRRLSDLQKDPQSAKILQPHLEAIERPKLWRLTADPSGLIVCTLPVRVRQDTPPSDVLRISEAVRAALHPLKLELTVHISVGNLGHLDALRASRLVTCAHGHGHGHSHSHSHSDDHHHSHDHSHSHGQGHSHSHDHDHGHFHSHGHDHGHLHHQDHPRPHSRKHSQSHSLTPAIPIHTSEAHLLLSPVDPDPFSPGSETHDSLLEHHHDHPSFDDSPDSHSSDSDDQSSPNIVHNDLMHHHHHLCH